MVGNPYFAGEHPDYLFLSPTAIPMLRDAGVSQEAIDQMLVGNAQAFFAA